MRGIIAYCAILGAAICGFVHGPTWVYLGSLVVLQLCSPNTDLSLYRRADALGRGARSFYFFTLLQSIGNSMMAIAAGYVLGLIVGVAMPVS